MPMPIVALRLKKIRRRFGIAAPNVVVRTLVPWQWYVVAGVVAGCVVMAISWGFVQRGEVGSINLELEALRLRVRELDGERLMSRPASGAEQNVVLLERSVQNQLMSRVRVLELENAALKEDILLFERLVPIPGGEPLVRIENLRLVKDGDGRFRYRLLVAFQPARQFLSFRGRLQLVVFYKLGGLESMLQIPGNKDLMSDFLVETKHFWRKEGFFELPLGAQLLRVEARLLQGDVLKAKRETQL